MRVDIAGRDVTRYLKALIRKEGFNFRTTAEFEIVRSIKETACYLSTNPLKEENIDAEKVLYTLPDGNTFDVSLLATPKFKMRKMRVVQLMLIHCPSRLDQLDSVHRKCSFGPIS